MSNSAKALKPDQDQRLRKWLGVLAPLFEAWSSADRLWLYRTLAVGDAAVLENGKAVMLDDDRQAVLYRDVAARYRENSTLTRSQFNERDAVSLTRSQFSKRDAVQDLTGPHDLGGRVAVAQLESALEPGSSPQPEPEPEQRPREVRRRNRAPSGKPRKVVVSVRLEPDQVEALEREADGEAVGMIIRRIVRDYLRGKGVLHG